MTFEPLPRIAIVTVTYNSAEVLSDFLASLSSQRERAWRLVVIDNASTDDTINCLKSWGDSRLTLICNQENVGFARATNQGIGAAIEWAEWILVLNNDTVFSAATLDTLLRRAERGDAAIYAPHIVYESDPSITWYGGGRFTNAWGFHATLDGDGQSNWLPATSERWVDFAPGCCQLISADLLRRYGSFDEDYFVYWEDVDRCWKWYRAGQAIRYLPDPVIRHKVSALTGGASSPFSIRMYHLNQIIFLRKNFRTSNAVFRSALVVVKIMIRAALRRDTLAQTQLRLRAVNEGWNRELLAHGTAG